MDRYQERSCRAPFRAAATVSGFTTPTGTSPWTKDADFATDKWELYHLEEDFSESVDLAATYPDELEEMIARWWAETRANQVLPLDDRGFAERANQNFRPYSPRGRKRFVYLNGMQHLGNAAAAPVPGRSVEISAETVRETTPSTARSSPTVA